MHLRALLLLLLLAYHRFLSARTDIVTARTYGCCTLRNTESDYACSELFRASFLEEIIYVRRTKQPKDPKHIPDSYVNLKYIITKIMQ